MVHVGSVQKKKVMWGLGPSRMGEQISETDERQQNVILSANTWSLWSQLSGVHRIKGTWNQTKTRFSIMSDCGNDTTV